MFNKKELLNLLSDLKVVIKDSLEVLNNSTTQDSYEDRKIDTTILDTNIGHKIIQVIVDTVSITDSTKPYETAIACQLYNDNNWIVVEEYDTKTQAEEGHNKWINIFTETLPDELKDVSTTIFPTLLSSLYPDRRVYKRSDLTAGSDMDAKPNLH